MKNLTTATTDDDVLCRDLLALAPRLRAFALSLCRDMIQAEDLVQDTLLKAWEFRSQYKSGTLLLAWTFTILRNKFLDDRRRSWRICELDPDVAENSLRAISDPTAVIALDELRRALADLPKDQRDAVMLVGAGGYAYEEAAEICATTTGTIKSRTNRARTRLRELLETGRYGADGLPCGAAMGALLTQLEQIGSRQPALGQAMA